MWSKHETCFVDHEFPCSISGGGSVPLAAYSNVQPAQESIATERHGSPFPVDMTIVNRALLLKNHRDRPKNQPIKKSQCKSRLDNLVALATETAGELDVLL